MVPAPTSPARARLLNARPQARVYAQSLARLPPDLQGAQAALAEILLYPVKGFGAVSTSVARVEASGLVDQATGLRDRSVMLAHRRPPKHEGGQPYDLFSVSNRIDPTVSLVRARLDPDGVVYEAPSLPPLRLGPEAFGFRAGPRARVKMYHGGPIIEGIQVDSELAAWARRLFRAHPHRRPFDADDVVAVHPIPGEPRPVAEKHRAGQEASTLLGDGAHVLVASNATLEWMNQSLQREGEPPIEMAAFRPNLVLEGLLPNAEDLIGRTEIQGPDGPVALQFVNLCTRCDATRAVRATGTRRPAQPLAWLSQNRPPRADSPGSTTFAINSVFPSSAHGRRVRVGDRVDVLSELAA